LPTNLVCDLGGGVRGRSRGLTQSVIIGIALAALLPFVPAHVVSDVTPAQAVSDPVIAAAGDIACDPADPDFNGGSGQNDDCMQAATAALLSQIDPDAVLPLGDNQYYCGGYNAFLQSYNLSWGQHLPKTYPAVGNHEYLTSGGTDCSSGAAGYFSYYSNAAKVGASNQLYYSYDIGSWHLIALNSNCASAGGCGPTSPQGQWLAADLVANDAPCTLAYWHIPVWSSGGRDSSNMASITQQLYNAGADVVLTGHDHVYERFAPQNPQGQPDPGKGIRAFVVGTGGANHTPFAATMPNSEVRNASAYGVLKMTLHGGSYDWSFVPVAGQSFTDSGSQTCHNYSGSPLPPPDPRGRIIGSVDAVERTSKGTYHIVGWAIDTDTASPIAVAVYVDGVLVAFTPAAADDRPDVEAVYPTFGAAHGFDLTFIAPAGQHQVCTGALNAPGTAGSDQALGCRVIDVPSLVGNFESLSIAPGGLTARGWALDPDATDQPIAVAVYDNGQLAAYTPAAAGNRPDVGAVSGFGSNHGFDLSWAATPGRHEVCVVAYNIRKTNGSDRILGCTSFVRNATIGNLELISRTGNTVSLFGWAIDTATAGPARIAVFVDGQLAAFGVAELPRPDVQAAFPAFGSNHGFQADISTSAGGHEVCVAAGNATFDPARVIVLTCTAI
jgi:hypothetical protein